MNPEHLLDEDGSGALAADIRDVCRLQALVPRAIQVYLQTLAEALKSTPWRGADRDEPEGMRYIMVSETAIEKIVADLDRAATMLASDALVFLGRDITPEDVARFRHLSGKSPAIFFRRTGDAAQ